MDSYRVDGDDVALVHACGDNLDALKLNAIDVALRLWGKGSAVCLEKIDDLGNRTLNGGFRADITVRLTSEPTMEFGIPDPPGAAWEDLSS